jgi:anti-sigma-K factor RskA
LPNDRDGERVNYRRPELQQRLACEYVLGTLHGLARKRFVALMHEDRRLRDTVASWEHALTPMATALPATTPGTRVWEGIAQRVAPAARKQTLRERMASLASWRPYAIGLFLGVGLMFVGSMLSQTAPNVDAQDHVPAIYAGFLQDTNGNVHALVSSLRHGRLADVKLLRPVPVAADRVLRLWALPSGGPPISLGAIPNEGKATLTLPATSEELLSKAAELAVSSEPAAAPEPTRPTQPFVLRGPCAKFW